MAHTYKYPRPAVTVDVVVFGRQQDEMHVLLIRRGQEPFVGHWALPGGFVDMEEDLDAAARRELAEETGVTDVSVRQIGAYGTVGRDPRGRVISIAYWAEVHLSEQVLRAADDANEARWFSLVAAMDTPLAFDHDKILRDARKNLK